MATNDRTAAAWSPEDLTGGWQHETTIIEFQRDGSYRIVIVEVCREEIISCGTYAVEQSELKLDPVIENEADLPSKATYRAVYRVDLRNPDQLEFQVSPDADDQNAKRKALLDGREFQRIASDDSLVLTVRKTSRKIRKHLDCLTPAAHKWWGPAAIAWLGRVGTGQGDPVRIKNLEKVLAHLQVLQHFLESGRPSCAQTRATLSCLLTQLDSPETVSFNSAWEIADLLEGELLRIGDPEYIEGIWHTWPPDRIPVWVREAIAKKEEDNKKDTNWLCKLLRPFLQEDQRDLVQEYRRDRAMISLRRSYLNVMGIALLFLNVAFCFLYGFATTTTAENEGTATTTTPESEATATITLESTATRETEALATTTTPESAATATTTLESTATPESAAPVLRMFAVSTPTLLVLLFMVTGAMGSVAGRATKLSERTLPSQPSTGKEMPLGIRSLMSAGSVFFAQVMLGATAGLIVYLVFEGSLLGLKDVATPTSASRIVLAFIAGFSEPFLTDVVGKVSTKVV